MHKKIFVKKIISSFFIILVCNLDDSEQVFQNKKSNPVENSFFINFFKEKIHIIFLEFFSYFALLAAIKDEVRCEFNVRYSSR